MNPTVSFGQGRKSGTDSMSFRFGLKMFGVDIKIRIVDIITRSSGGAEGTCDTTG